MTCYAHSLPGQPKEKWQPLEEHLRQTAELARQFAEPFGADDWAYIAGLWHDLGKYSEEFQAYLLAENDIPLGSNAPVGQRRTRQDPPAHSRIMW